MESETCGVHKDSRHYVLQPLLWSGDASSEDDVMRWRLICGKIGFQSIFLGLVIETTVKVC